MALNELKDNPLRHLWLVDDKAWMKQRKADWLCIEKGMSSYTKMDIAKAKKFYVNGDYYGYLGPAWCKYLYIPFKDAVEASEAFHSRFMGTSDQETILRDFVFSGFNRGYETSDVRQRMVGFVEAVLGDVYKEIHCLDHRGNPVKGPAWSWWTQDYIDCATYVFDDVLAYHAVVECREYFLSALRFGQARKDYHRIPNLPDFLVGIEKLLAMPIADEAVAQWAEQMWSVRDELLAIHQSWQPQ